MRILQIIPNLGSGGAEHFVAELSNELSRQGHDVELLSLSAIPDNNPLRESLDTRVKLSTLNKKNGLWIGGFTAVYNYIRKNNYDVVHAHVGAIKYITLASMICRNKRFIATIHSEAKREAGKSIDRWSRKLMFRLKFCVPVTISIESERSFEGFYGRKGVMIFNGVSDYRQKKVLQLRDRDNQIVFLHPASCQTVKNQELLFKAFNRLLDDGIDAKVVWVGNNKIYYDLFKSLEPLMRSVSFLGEVDNVRDFMVASDAVCLSSKMEGMPMTIIEAFSVGRPVLCTPVGGCLNMIKNGENGLLSKDLSVESYYQMLSSFASMYKEDREYMGNNAFVSSNDYTIENCANKYLKIYENEL